MSSQGAHQRELEEFERETLAALDSVYRFAMQLTRDQADTDDLVQDTFLRAFKNRHQYELGTNCTAWLFTICRNLWVQKRQREERVTTFTNQDLDELATINRHRPGQEDGRLQSLLERPEFDDVLKRALDSIPETYRIPVVLIDVEDQTYAGAAQVLGVPVGTVRSRLFRGRRLLQEQLMAYAEDAGVAPRKPCPTSSDRRTGGANREPPQGE